MRGVVILLILSLIVVGLTPGVKAQSDAQIVITATTDISKIASSGSGTASNPYVIGEGLTIVATTGPGIQISGTTKHITIRGTTILAGGPKFDAITIRDASNVIVDSVDLQFNKAGVQLVNARSVTIRDSSIRASQYGIVFENTSGIQVLRNEIAVNEQDVAFVQANARIPPSTKNVFRENNLSIATGQFGFHFASNASFDNDIDSSNVVNFVPMRWHVNVRGTAAAPKSIADEAVDVKGMTNFAQVMCYNCSHVLIDRITASNGRASGLQVERSDNVTIGQIFAEGNEGAGLQLRNVFLANVASSSFYANRIGFYAHNASFANLTSSTVSTNKQAVLTEYGNNTAIRSNLFERNTDDGIIVDHANRTLTEGNTYSTNGGDAIRLSGTNGVTIRDESIKSSGASGVHVTDSTFNTTISNIRSENNGRGGITISKGALFTKATSNILTNNSDAGIVLSEAGILNRLTDNELSDQKRHIHLTKSGQSIFSGNQMTTGPGQTGIWFDDETSYNNTITTSNTVGGTSVQWHVAVGGTPLSPLQMTGLRVETPNMTNIAQVMIYKGSYIDLTDTVASGGVRGIYTLRSSSMRIENAQLTDNGVGLDLRGTQTANVRNVRTTGGETSVLLLETLNVTVADVAGPGTRVVVDTDARARGSIIERVDATDVREMSVRDRSNPKEPRHLIADAGLDKLVAVGNLTYFNDTTGVARFGSERIVHQSWDFGDGETDASGDPATLRPSHNYTAGGNYTATYTLQTADGRILTDTVKIRVVPPPEMPVAPDVDANKSSGAVTLNWTPPASEFPVKSYRVYRGLNATNLTLLLETVNNATTTKEKFDKSMDVFYAITAVSFGGESALSEPFKLNITAPPPPPPKPTATPTGEDEDETPTNASGEGAKTPGPGFALLLAAAAGVALALRRRS